MQNDIANQLNGLDVLLYNLFNRGPSCWNYYYATPLKTDFNFCGLALNTEELGEVATEAKRKGEYSDALRFYIAIIKTYNEAGEQIPVSVMRSLYKVLMCINAFGMAFSLVATIFSDMQKSYHPNEVEKTLFQQYFMKMISLAISVTDNHDFSLILSYVKDLSGNPSYSFFQTNASIEEEMRSIRQQVRQIYGM